jgi:hypothetical protein
MKLITPEELAEAWSVPVEEVHRLRKQYGWPHVQINRRTVRFTEGHVAHIIASLAKEDAKAAKPSQQFALVGQTRRSANKTKEVKPARRANNN